MLFLFMDSSLVNLNNLGFGSEFLIAIITVLGTIIVAMASSYLTYRYTRKMQLEAEWRKDKIRYYGELLNSITELLGDPEDRNKAFGQFAASANIITLIAPQEITDVLFEFYYNWQIKYRIDISKMATEKIDGPTEPTNEEWVKLQILLLKQLVLSIRKDLRISPKDNHKTFKFRLRSPISTLE